jgi:hypothetical protein
MCFAERVRAAAVAAAILVGIGPAAVAEAQEITRQISVDGSFGDGYVNWPGLPGGYYFKARVIAVDGQLELCGVGVFTDAYTRSTEQQVLGDTRFTMNGESILEDLTFFARANRKRDLGGATANCARTKAAVPNGDVAFDIDVPNRRYRF